MGSSTRTEVIAAIRAAGPSPGEDVLARLASVPAAVLLAIGMSSEPWWTRRTAIQALAGKVDATVAGALQARILDAGETSEVRQAAMVLLAGAGRTEIIPALRRVRAELEAMDAPPYGLHDAVVSASARLGDPAAIRPALALRYDAWSHRRRMGDEAIAALEAALGRDGVMRTVGGESLDALARRHADPNVRRWAVDVAPPGDAAMFLAALVDPEWVVAEGAHAALLRASDEVLEPLRELALEPRFAPVVRARAILAILRRGATDSARELWGRLDARIGLPAVPDHVRRTILRNYAPGERGSDPRWELEAELDVDPEATGELPEEIIAAAHGALARAGLQPGRPIPIGEVHEQGGGSYVHIPIGDSYIEVCELGRYYSVPGTHDRGVREALENARFFFIDESVGGALFEGLGVYYFGRREPLRVQTLLFYWQD